jgi:hypothetical protein
LNYTEEKAVAGRFLLCERHASLSLAPFGHADE